jgi:ABC-2 type transport system permease protein
LAENVTMINAPEEPLAPREVRLEQAAVILRWGALANGAVVALLLVLAFIGGLKIVPNLFNTLQTLLLGRVAVDPDAAVAIVILTVLVNISLLLVLMVGVLARELWALGGLWLAAAINVAALVLLGFLPALVTIVFAVWSGIRVARDMSNFRINPVMLKELRGRMRGIRAFIVLSVYLGLMSAFTALLYLIFTTSTVGATGSGSIGAIGRVLFIGLVGIELLLIIFIAPAFTAGAITGERERQTYDLLRTTLLASPSFVIGKLESALGYILLLLFSAIPLQSIAFLFGGVTELEVILSFVILAVTAVTLGTVGIFFSAVTPRTLSASVRSYTVALAVTFGIPILLSFPLLNAFNTAVQGIGSGIVSLPVIETVFLYIGMVLVSLNPIATALTSQQLLAERQVLGMWTVTLASDGSTIPLVSPWISFAVLYLVISTVLIVLAVREMRKVEA